MNLPIKSFSQVDREGNRVIRWIHQTNLCNGCGDCFAYCPNNAITMKVSFIWFYEPYVMSIDVSNCGYVKRLAQTFGLNAVVASNNSKTLLNL